MARAFKTTWLYVKRHKSTGLMYFGKTTKDPYKYSGSGKYWLRHLKAHGYDIETLFAKSFDCPDQLAEFADKFSSEHMISKSEAWANLRDENGFDGAPVGHEPHQFTDEQRSKISAASTAKWSDKSFREKVVASQKAAWTPERRAKNSEQTKSSWTPERRKKHSELMSKWKPTDDQLKKMRKPKHDGFGEKVSAAMKGRKKSAEHCKALSEAAKRRYENKRKETQEMTNQLLLKGGD